MTANTVSRISGTLWASVGIRDSVTSGMLASPAGISLDLSIIPPFLIDCRYLLYAVQDWITDAHTMPAPKQAARNRGSSDRNATWPFCLLDQPPASVLGT